MSAVLTSQVEKLITRQGDMEKAISALGQRRAGLNPEKVFGMMGDDPGKWPVLGDSLLYGHKKRLSGIGSALVAMAQKARGDNSVTHEQIEKQHGFMTLDRFKGEGRKEANGQVTKAALAEGSGITGGYVVPPQFVNQLMRLAIEDAFIRPRCTVLPMTSRTMQVPSLDVTTAQSAGTTPFLGGILAQWQPEAADISETEPTFRQTELTAWDLVFISIASNQLLADNAVALDALLTQLFGEAIVWYSEYAFLQGMGAGSRMPLGVLNAPALYTVTSRTTSAHFNLADAARMLSRLLVSSWKDACWVMHPSVLSDLIQMTNGATNSPFLVWMNPAPSNDSNEGPAALPIPARFFGLPIFFTEKVPVLGTKGDVMLIDWTRYLVGDRMELQIDVSPHVKFVQNQLMWRVIARMDGRPWLNNVVTMADGSYQMSPFVALAT